MYERMMSQVTYERMMWQVMYERMMSQVTYERMMSQVMYERMMSQVSTDRSLLVHICAVHQQVHHTVIVTLPSGPDQRSGAVLRGGGAKNGQRWRERGKEGREEREREEEGRETQGLNHSIE